MKNETSRLSMRWIYISLCTVCLAFAGVIYAWSILKVPLAAEFGWSNTELALNFTLTMCTFCIGGFLGSRIAKLIGANLSLILAGLLAGGGFVIASFMSGSIIVLYVSYALLAGLGIGVAYNVIIAAVNAWFPDKRGFCSGCLLMGFGMTSLVFGSLLDAMFASESFGWRKTFLWFGIIMAAMICLAGIVIRKPSADVVFPEGKKKAKKKEESFEVKDMSPLQMLSRPSFWISFVYVTCLVAVGNSVISFAKDLALSTGASAAL
ncbi:MAG: MFS transporter, partial [Clostridia bacterium]|nr:MFS transporter [Clostridia bacterium]